MVSLWRLCLGTVDILFSTSICFFRHVRKLDPFFYCYFLSSSILTFNFISCTSSSWFFFFLLWILFFHQFRLWVREMCLLRVCVCERELMCFSGCPCHVICYVAFSKNSRFTCTGVKEERGDGGRTETKRCSKDKGITEASRWKL